MKRLRHHLLRLARNDDGVAIVEFAIALPMMLLVFAVIIEGSRLMIAYQSTIAGVRDATRYLSSVLPRRVRRAFDLVGWDPRGTGRSEGAVDCIDDDEHDRFFAGYDVTPDDAAVTVMTTVSLSATPLSSVTVSVAV